MSSNTLEKTEKVEISAQAKGVEGGSELENVVNVEQVKEIVEISHEGDVTSGGASDDSSQAVFSWASISDTVGRLIPKKQPKSLEIPSEGKQKVRLEKVLHKNIRKLSRQANHMIGSKRFSADKYEELISQIRRFRSMLDELLEVAAETLELWYKQYVLKVA